VAEERLGIRIDVQTATLQQAKEHIKGLKKELLELPVTSEKAKELNSEILRTEDALRKASGRGETFHETLKGVRRGAEGTRFAIVALMGGFEGLAKSIAVVSGAGKTGTKQVTDISNALAGAATSGLAVSYAMRLAGGSMAAVAPYAAIAVGALSAVAGIMGSLNQNTEAADDSIVGLNKRIFELQHKTGKIDDFEYMSFLRKEVLRTEAEKNRFGGSGANAHQSYTVEDKKKAELAYLVALDEEQTNWNRVVGAINKGNEGYKEMIRLRSILTAKEPGAGLRQSGIRTGARAPSDQRATGVDFVPGLPGVDPRILMTDMQKLATGPLLSGFDRVGNSIMDNIIGPLAQSKNIFSQFLAGVLEGLGQIAMKLASSALVAGIFSMFGGGFGSVFSALSGGLLGGNAPTGVSNRQLATATSFGGGMGSRTVVEVRARGREFYGVMKQEKIIDSKAGGRW
jgi:hypothetical protein